MFDVEMNDFKNNHKPFVVIPDTIACNPIPSDGFVHTRLQHPDSVSSSRPRDQKHMGISTLGTPAFSLTLIV